MQPAPYLHTTDLSVGYKNQSTTKYLFQNLNIALHTNQLVCFMGPNGAGKSSLIRTLAGLQKPLAGNVHFNNTHYQRSPQQLSVVLTDKIHAPHMTVHELICFGRYPYVDWKISFSEKDKSIVKNAIQQINIHHLIDHKLYQLSDGQLQMVMIARALAQDTPIILLDEPTAHLDLNNRVEIMNQLRVLSRTMNKAILVATHELDLALQTADVIWLTDKNKNILRGIPEDLVLDGSFDEIFQFKGFDLRTGKIQHVAHRGVTIQLKGEGYEYLWTKNALERCGFIIHQEPEPDEELSIAVHVYCEESKPRWSLKKSNRQLIVNSIAALIEQL
jgi:iron complex transport system ATP-binding protein